ncbi:MAG: EAL domain-containing protein [Planctomycetota bacterium]
MIRPSMDTSPLPLAVDENNTAQRWLLSGQISEQEPVREYQVHEGTFTVGRRSDSSLCLPVGCVSKNHAEIHNDGSALHIKDLGSTNGTFVNGQRIEASCRINDGDLLQFASIVFRVCLQGHVTEHQTIHEDSCDQALALIQFDRLIESGAFIPYFQPIITMHDQQRIGYEVLGRSRIFGLQTPLEMFHAASQLNLESQLSEVFRQRGVEIGARFGSNTNLFVNTHPKELGTEDFYKSLYALRENCDQTITLEIHERAATDSQIMSRLARVLKELDIKLAFDDFGVGEARLVELGEYRPDFLKFDMQLTRSIDTASPKRLEVVQLLAKLVLDLGIQPLAEGIENLESHQILTEMGFIYGQGFYYGKPLPISKYLNPNAAVSEAEAEPIETK